MASSMPYIPRFRLLGVIVLFTLLIDLTSAQTLISPTLPSCGQQCPVLLQAQGGCVPPAAPVTNQGIYQSCFCQSAFLQPLHGGPTPLCPTCSTQDMATVQTWFQGLCKQGAPVQQPGPTSTVTSSSSSTSAAPAATSSAGLTGVNESATPSGPTRGWYYTLLTHPFHFCITKIKFLIPTQDVHSLALGRNGYCPLRRTRPRRFRLLAPPPPLPP